MAGYKIESVIQTSLRDKSVWVVMQNDTPTISYRRAEIKMPLSVEDEEAYLDTYYTPVQLWQAGVAVELDKGTALWQEATEKPRVNPIYRKVILQTWGALIDGDVDAARVTANQILNQNLDVKDKVLAILQGLGLATPSTDGEKREQLYTLFLIAFTGILNGER